MLAWYMLSLCLSIHLFDTSQSSMKMVKPRITAEQNSDIFGGGGGTVPLQNYVMRRFLCMCWRTIHYVHDEQFTEFVDGYSQRRNVRKVTLHTCYGVEHRD